MKPSTPMTSKHVFIYSISCLIFSVFLVVFLYTLSVRPNTYKNGFTRKHTPPPLKNVRALSLGGPSFYFAGATDSKLYLGNYQKPDELIITDYSLKDTARITLNIPPNEKLAWRALKIIVRYPEIFVIEGITPTILHASFPDQNFRRLSLDTVHFDLPVVISASSFAFRFFDPRLNSRILAKASINPPSVINSPSALEKQQDGIFSTDGIFMYDADTRQLVYVYFYRNQYVCLDTSLRAGFRGKTIDTNHLAKLTIGVVRSENKRMLASPALNVNRHASIFNKQLFIHSELMADNDPKEQFARSAAIDVYSLESYSYLFSFFIPIDNGAKIKDFRITKTHIATFQDDRLLVYDFKIDHP